MSIIKPFFYSLSHTFILIRNELKRNAFAWLAPLPVLLVILYWSSRIEWTPIKLNMVGTWLYFLFAIILVMVYGLQSFSNEADCKTLDFILTKPISPYSIIAAKYLSGLAIFSAWLGIFNTFLSPDLALLNLPKGIGPEWLILVLLTVHAVSFFSGLLARGLERFFVITVLTLIIGSGAYYIWQKVFALIMVNYMWFDIPPRLLFILEKFLPYYLAAISLLTPLIGVVWGLKSRIKIWRFKSAQILFGIWLLNLIIIQIAYFSFSPLVWPDKNAKSGDWNPIKGIVLVGTDITPSDSDLKISQSYLSLNRSGRKPRKIYAATDLKNPRFSPDGNQIVFSENSRIKIYDFVKKTVLDIGEGEVAAWNNDGQSLITAKKTGSKGLSLLFVVDLAHNNQSRRLSSLPELTVADLVWDSQLDQLFVFDYTDHLYCYDLKNNITKKLEFPENDQPKYFGVIKPALRFQKEDGMIFIGQVFDRTIKVYILNTKNNNIWLSEQKTDFRILTNGPLLFNQDGTGYLWPRIDGGLIYNSTYYDRNHDHDHEHFH